jgi:hypothetical protein
VLKDMASLATNVASQKKKVWSKQRMAGARRDAQQGAILGKLG